MLKLQSRHEVPLLTWNKPIETIPPAALNILAIATLRRGTEYTNHTLTDVLQLFTGFTCTDDRDHIFAVLGLASNFVPGNQLLDADYSEETTPTDIFRRFALWSLFEEESLNFLSLGRDRKRPFWVPNFAAGAVRRNIPISWTGFRATLDYEPMASISTDGQRLCVAGTAIDRIAKLGDISPLAPDMDEFSDTQALDIFRQWLRVSQQRYRDYFFGCLSLLGIEYRQCTPSQQHLPSHRDRYLTFIRTLIWDQPYQGHTIEQTMQDCEDYLRMILTGKEVVIATFGSGYLMTSTFNEGRRLCLTADGRMGYVPGDAKVGDTVCLLYGGALPYVIRECGNGEYQFLGDCYIEGEMYGNRLKIEPDIESFTLI
jgi:hypothetical protein